MSCRGCGKPMSFLKTPGGRSMPVDPDPVRFSDGGQEVFVLESGTVCRGRRDDSGPMVGYVTHWSTCPVSDRFRGSKKDDDDPQGRLL